MWESLMSLKAKRFIMYLEKSALGLIYRSDPWETLLEKITEWDLEDQSVVLRIIFVLLTVWTNTKLLIPNILLARFMFLTNIF